METKVLYVLLKREMLWRTLRAELLSLLRLRRGLRPRVHSCKEVRRLSKKMTRFLVRMA
jgi:hypothetical protein